MMIRIITISSRITACQFIQCRLFRPGYSQLMPMLFLCFSMFPAWASPGTAMPLLTVASDSSTASEQAEPPLDEGRFIQASRYLRNLHVGKQSYNKEQYELAFKRLLPYAKAGEKMAQYLVGMMYLNGQGRESDIVEAYGWLTVAVEQKNKRWLRFYREFTRDLTRSVRTKLLPVGEEFIRLYGVKAQKLGCQRISIVGSNRKEHTCKKTELRPGQYFVSEAVLKEMEAVF